MTIIGANEMTAEELPEFSVLLHRHQNMVFSIACHFLHDRAAAEDVAQEVFLQLHRKLPTLKSEAHISAWLCKVTGHRCIDYLRRQRRDVALDKIPEPAAEERPGDPVLAGRLRRLVATLPPKARLAMILRYQEDLEPEEISRRLGWRLNTVKSLLQRSLGMLRDKLSRTVLD